MKDLILCFQVYSYFKVIERVWKLKSKNCWMLVLREAADAQHDVFHSTLISYIS